LGGEEFVLLLPDVKLEDAVATAERVRDACEHGCAAQMVAPLREAELLGGPGKPQRPQHDEAGSRLRDGAQTTTRPPPPIKQRSSTSATFDLRNAAAGYGRS
jgi:GGDEF domain-containing protein